MQQKQTVQALIGEVDGLTKLVQNNERKDKMDEKSQEENTKLKQFNKGNNTGNNRKSHVLLGSNIEDICPNRHMRIRRMMNIILTTRLRLRQESKKGKLTRWKLVII